VLVERQELPGDVTMPVDTVKVGISEVIIEKLDGDVTAEVVLVPSILVIMLMIPLRTLVMSPEVLDAAPLDKAVAELIFNGLTHEPPESEVDADACRRVGAAGLGGVYEQAGAG
jgi:hypothetical protein